MEFNFSVQRLLLLAAFPCWVQIQNQQSSIVNQKMIRLIPAAIFLMIQCACAIEIRIPESWSQGEVPSSEVPFQMPQAIRPMIRLIPPTEDGTASISEMKPLMSLDEATKSYVRGMPMRGISVDATSNVSQNGHDGRRIKGHMSLAGRDITFPVEAFILETEDCILTVEVISKDASSMLNEVLSWIDFQAEPLPAKAPDANGTAGRSFWEYVGIGVVLLAVGYAICNSKFTHKRRSDNNA